MISIKWMTFALLYFIKKSIVSSVDRLLRGYA